MTEQLFQRDTDGVEEHGRTHDRPQFVEFMRWRGTDPARWYAATIRMHREQRESSAYQRRIDDEIDDYGAAMAYGVRTSILDYHRARHRFDALRRYREAHDLSKLGDICEDDPEGGLGVLCQRLPKPHYDYAAQLKAWRQARRRIQARVKQEWAAYDADPLGKKARKKDTWGSSATATHQI